MNEVDHKSQGADHMMIIRWRMIIRCRILNDCSDRIYGAATGWSENGRKKWAEEAEKPVGRWAGQLLPRWPKAEYVYSV